MGPDGAGDADKVTLGQQILLETLLRRGQDKLCAKVTYLMSLERMITMALYITET